jgi:hypothetical protein
MRTQWLNGSISAAMTLVGLFIAVGPDRRRGTNPPIPATTAPALCGRPSGVNLSTNVPDFIFQHRWCRAAHDQPADTLPAVTDPVVIDGYPSRAPVQTR